MKSKERIEIITKLLKRDYPDVVTPLLHQSAHQLLIATMLSAQTLDATVNKVTPKLFEKYKLIEDFANVNIDEFSKDINSVNYFKTKARNVLLMANMVIKEFDGIIPHTIENLTKLPGVGRKTANVLISEWYAKPYTKRGNPFLINTKEDIIVLPEGFVVDTHVLRSAKRLGLTKNSKPEKVEKDLMEIFPREEWNDMSLRLIFHGRYRCKSQNPQCYLDPEWSKICSCVKNKK